MPQNALSEINKQLKIFLWGGYEEKTKISWVKWGEVYRDKSRGGLGLKDLQCYNLALVGKWVWRVLNCEEGLLLRVLKSKYGDRPFEVGRRGSLISSSGNRERTQVSGWWKDLCELF